MPSPTDDDLEARVRILEREVNRLRQQMAVSSADAAAARVLAGGADQDVSDVRAELRAHTQTLNALRETQLELRETQLEQGHRITALDTDMPVGFATMDTGMAHVTALLEGIAGSGQE